MRDHSSINSQLYHKLFTEGGDRLVAVYCMLRATKGSRDYIRSTDKLKGHSLLRKETGMAVKTLKKYVSKLESLNLCRFTKDGSFSMTGRIKINQEYTTQSKYYKHKFVRVVVGKSIADTALNSYKIRLHALESTLKRRIDREAKLRNIFARKEAGLYLHHREYTLWKESTLPEKHTYISEQPQLSIKGFGKMKTGNWDELYKGQYWKKKVVNSGFIKTRRYSIFIRKCSRKEFEELSWSPDLRKLNHYKGGLYQETTSIFSTAEKIELKQDIDYRPRPKVKPKDYLQFDMLAWWMNAED